MPLGNRAPAAELRPQRLLLFLDLRLLDAHLEFLAGGEAGGMRAAGERDDSGGQQHGGNR
ncbi:hypothetical protein D3C83_261710 [compost metagenome]